ncbi:polysaccharide pyruvyl transferase family protein [Empedobacter falsenii]
MGKEFNNLDKIENLRNIVRKSLSKHIDGDYVLLDVPNYRNIGDTLIWQGELEYLKEFTYKCNYTSNPYVFKDEKIKSKDIILLQGGGNFGDVWPVNQSFRNEIISKYKENKIIIFPQTIHYNKKENIINDAKIYNNHPNLIICVRDLPSKELADKYFYNCEILLLPDMAFFNDFTNFHNSSSKKVLIMKREDKEKGELGIVQKIINHLENNNKEYDIKDWPGFLKEGTIKRRLQYYQIRSEIEISKKFKNLPILNLLIDDRHGLKRRDYKDHQLLKGIDFINQYDTIYSTRLHGFILSVLLNKKVFVFDNSYGKNKNFFMQWLKDFENVELIDK